MIINIRSRHPSHDILRGKIKCTKPTIFRLGSFTSNPDDRDWVEINTVTACMNSSNKKEMKRLFAANNVKTAIYCNPANEAELTEWVVGNNIVNKKLIIKSYRGSRGKGLYLVNGLEEAVNFFTRRGYGGHIIERYYNYNKEYRLHVDKDGCFYTCRKMLKDDATTRWYRNDSNCVWITENNPLFSKPDNWDDIVDQCVNALNAVGLTIGACDVRVSSNNSNNFIVCEINSAPSFGELTAQHYIKILSKYV